jgi:hexosaminidase
MKRPFVRRALAGMAITLLVLAGCARPDSDAGAATASAPITPALIPAPTTLQVGEGSFVINAGTRLSATGEPATRVAGQFAAYLQSAGGPALAITDADGKNGIRFVLETGDAAAASPEAYTLDITPDGVTVKARDERGLFYGAVTLWQLATQGDKGVVTLPALHIEDAPRFAWRGFMLDPARHFQTVDEVKRIIDAMALHKLNTLHWHLTDDQGWRIEIKQYPKLTEIGGCRIPAGDGGKDPKTGEPRPYCGFYTQDQIRDVVTYAAERHITVVPEINVPVTQRRRSLRIRNSAPSTRRWCRRASGACSPTWSTWKNRRSRSWRTCWEKWCSCSRALTCTSAATKR